MASRTKNSVRNIAFGFGYQGLTLLLSFVNRSVFLQCLSVDYLGIQGLFSDILTMLSLADLGFGTAMTFSMYEPLARGDHQKLAGLTTFYKKVYRVIAGVIVVIGVSLVPALGWLVNTQAEIPHLRLYYLLYLANTVASYFVVYKTCILQADQKAYLITRNNMMFSTASSITTCIFLLLTRNYVVYLSIQVLFTYLQNFCISRQAEKRYPYIQRKVQLPKDEVHSIFENIGSVFLYKVSSVLINATDNTLISVLVGTGTVGYYSNYTIVTTKLSGIINTFFYSLTASLGNLIVDEKKEKRFHVFHLMQTVSAMLSTFCVVCVLLLQQDFIKVWLGEKFLLDRLTLIAIVMNFYFTIALLPVWVFREATGLYRKTRYVMLATAGINLVASIVLGKWIGLAGILFATSLARVLTYFWYEPRLLFKEYFGESCKIYFVGVAKSVGITMLTALICNASTGWIIVTGWLTLIQKGILVAMVCLAILWMFYRKSQGMNLILEKVKGWIRVKK